GMTRVPPSFIPPPVQVMAPVTVSVPAPFRLPPERAKSLWMVEAEANANDPADRTMGFWLSRLLTKSSAPPACVTVTPGILMVTSSAAVGTAPVLQLPGVSQSPLAGLTHMTAAGNVRSSSASSCKRTKGDLRARERLRTMSVAPCEGWVGRERSGRDAPTSLGCGVDRVIPVAGASPRRERGRGPAGPGAAPLRLADAAAVHRGDGCFPSSESPARDNFGPGRAHRAAG